MQLNFPRTNLMPMPNIQYAYAHSYNDNTNNNITNACDELTSVKNEMQKKKR